MKTTVSYKYYANEIVKSLRNLHKKKKYILHEPTLDKNDTLQLKKCISSTYVSTVSKQVSDFENNLSKYTNSKYVVAMINGTAAIEIAIKSIGVKQNQEILIPNTNYIASANSALREGAIPHFVDTNLNNLGIDIKKLTLYLKKISYIKNGHLINKKTKRVISAIIPTHVFGNACDIEEIVKLAKKFKLKVIEDSSEALGSFYKKKHLGTFGQAGVISFNGNKIITTGAGGALLTNDKKIFDKALHLSKIARKQNFFWEYDYNQLGYNYRMSGINASFGISQLKKIKKLLLKKKKLNNYYNKSLSSLKNVDLLKETKNSKWNYWLNNIFIHNINIKTRNKIIVELNKKKIFVRPLWKLMHKIEYLKKYPKMNMKNSLTTEKNIISLPSSPSLIK